MTTPAPLSAAAVKELGRKTGARILIAGSLTGRAGGAYLSDDVNEDGVQDWVALNDPRVFGEGRSIRIGATVQF